MLLQAWLAAALAILFTLTPCGHAAAPAIPVMILDGESNPWHDW
jgi:hypothetical protein